MKLCSAILLSHIFLCKCTSILLAPGSFFPATYPITITSMVLDNVQNMANHLDQRIVRLFHQDSITGVSYVWCYKGTGSEALAYCNIPSTVSTCITQSFTAPCSSRAHSLETTFQRLPCPRVLAPCGCQEVFRWDLEKRRRSHYSLLSSCR